MKLSLRNSAAASLLAFALIAPAPVFAQAAPGIGTAGAYASLWAKGSVMEAKGIVKLTKAQGDLARANRDIADAKDKQTQASSTSTTSAAEFRSLMATVPVFNTSADAHLWAKKVSDGAKRWTASDKRGAKGGKELAKATRNKKSAESEIVRAQAEIDQGRAIMADATRRAQAG
jgi:hypothetical protein